MSRFKTGLFLSMNIILKFLIILVFLLNTNILNASTKSYSDEQSLKAVHSWKEMMKFAEGKNTVHKLKIVNNYFNKLSFRSDIKNWKTKDYWATPFEFLTSGAGDCEDYAIAKYYTLRKLGIPENKLRITYVKYLKKRSKFEQAHMVLT